MKKQIPLLVVIVLGFMFVAYVFIPHKITDDFYNWYMDWMKVISSFAVVLAVGSLWLVHWNKITHKAPNWGYSIVTLAGIVVTASIGFIWGIEEGTPFMWTFEYLEVPLSSTMFSLLAFYIASAAYKAFRARSSEATILLIAGVIVMLGRVSIGPAITHWIPDVTEWILNVPNLAAKRGINIGVGLGIMATSLKIILGIERSYLGGRE
jgi:hypothetical protein